MTQVDTVPSDQPLPPYTIVNPPLAPAIVNGQPTTVRQGTHEHAAFIIEVPPDWNGELVMWAHGFRGNGTVLFVDPPGFGLRQRLLDQGYAWAASSYAGNGYDIRTGVLSTKALADLFGTTFDRPDRTYITGVSMGGHIIGRSLEQFPRYYDGALPMCGVLGDQALFDFFLDYNLVAQDLADVPAYPVPLDYLTTAVPQINAVLGIGALSVFNQEPTNDLGRQFRSITINRSGGDRPGANAAFAFWKNFLFGLAAPAVPPSPDDTTAMRPGQIATNVLTLYRPHHAGQRQPDDSAGPSGEPRAAALAAPDPDSEDRRAARRAGPVPARTGRPVRHLLHGAAVRGGRPAAWPELTVGPAGDPHDQPLRVQPGRGRRGLGRPGQLGREE